MDYSDVEEGNEDLLQELFSDESNDSKSLCDEKIQNTGAEEKKSQKKKLESDEPVRKVRKTSKNVVLNYDRLNGPNGLRTLKKSFENFKFKGNNHEKEDLTRIIQILKHWMCYQLFPKYSFEENVARLEYLGNRKPIQTLMKKMRLGIDSWGEINSNLMENKELSEKTTEEHEGENFDTWWQEQLANVDSSDDDNDDHHHYNNLSNVAMDDKNYDGNKDNDFNGENDADKSRNGIDNSCNNNPGNDNESFNSIIAKNTEISMISTENLASSNDDLKTTNVQKGTSGQPDIILTPEQLERIARNKKLAEERKLQRLSQKSQQV